MKESGLSGGGGSLARLCGLSRGDDDTREHDSQGKKKGGGREREKVAYSCGCMLTRIMMINSLELLTFPVQQRQT